MIERIKRTTDYREALLSQRSFDDLRAAIDRDRRSREHLTVNWIADQGYARFGGKQFMEKKPKTGEGAIAKMKASRVLNEWIDREREQGKDGKAS